MAKFRAADGRVVMRSTKQRDLRIARKVAETWEEASRTARSGELTQAASIKILSELMDATAGEKLTVETVQSFLRGWLASRDVAGRAASTVARYRPIIEGFLSSLPDTRLRASIGSVTGGEIERFRDAEVSSGKGATTANFAVKVLRAVFNAARRKGLALSNPAESVEMIAALAEERQPFTDEEICSLLDAAKDADWEGVILIGVWCGLRLSDVAALTWGAIDLENGTLTLLPEKGKRLSRKLLTIKLHPDVLDWLRSRSRGIAAAPLFPDLYGRKPGSAGGLSNTFSAIMKRAGIPERLGAKKSGKGRRFHEQGFHALRHTMVSRLAAADVSADVRRTMTRHSTDAIHSRYTHLDVSAQERALEKVPSLYKQSGAQANVSTRAKKRSSAR